MMIREGKDAIMGQNTVTLGPDRGKALGECICIGILDLGRRARCTHRPRARLAENIALPDMEEVSEL